MSDYDTYGTSTHTASELAASSPATSMWSSPSAKVTTGASTSSPRALTDASRSSRTPAERATLVVVNSVIFRSSGQNLTTAGTYVEMTSRLLEPTLLALAALAVRGRIKR